MYFAPAPALHYENRRGTTQYEGRRTDVSRPQPRYRQNSIAVCAQAPDDISNGHKTDGRGQKLSEKIKGGVASQEASENFRQSIHVQFLTEKQVNFWSGPLVHTSVCRLIPGP